MKPADDAMPSPIMTTPEVAQYLGIHYSTVCKWIRRGQIPAFKIGADYRFKRDVIEKWMADRQVKGQPLDPGLYHPGPASSRPSPTKLR